MIEEGIAFLAGVAVTLVGVLFWPQRTTPLDTVWDAAPVPFRGEHEHEPHILGTMVKNGQKHKKMYCGNCDKRWSEPC